MSIMQCLETSLSKSEMTTLTIDNSFVGNMQLGSVSVQQTTVCSVVTQGKHMCPVKKCHISAIYYKGCQFYSFHNGSSLEFACPLLTDLLM